MEFKDSRLCALTVLAEFWRGKERKELPSLCLGVVHEKATIWLSNVVNAGVRRLWVSAISVTASKRQDIKGNHPGYSIVIFLHSQTPLFWTPLEAA